MMWVAVYAVMLLASASVYITAQNPAPLNFAMTTWSLLMTLAVIAQTVPS